jgi:hypothetical protein
MLPQALAYASFQIDSNAVRTDSQGVCRNTQIRRKLFTPFDFHVLFVLVILDDDVAILVGKLRQATIETCSAFTPIQVVVWLWGFEAIRFLDNLMFANALKRLSEYELRDAINVRVEVIDRLAFFDLPCDAVNCFIGVDIRRRSSTPLEVFDQPETNALVFLTRFFTILVKHREKAVESSLR